MKNSFVQSCEEENIANPEIFEESKNPKSESSLTLDELLKENDEVQQLYRK